MEQAAFIQLMGYPKEWLILGLLPPHEFLNAQMELYQAEGGSEHQTSPCPGSEHYRFGAFNYWLRQNPPTAMLEQLLQLCDLDADQAMASDVRRRIARAEHATPAMRLLVQDKA